MKSSKSTQTKGSEHAQLLQQRFLLRRAYQDDVRCGQGAKETQDGRHLFAYIHTSKRQRAQCAGFRNKVRASSKEPVEEHDRWNFQFSDQEVETSSKLQNEVGDVFVSLIGLVEQGKPEVLFVDFDKAIDCLGVNLSAKGQRNITMIREPRKKLRIYGSGRSRTVNGVDNTLAISRSDVPFL